MSHHVSGADQVRTFVSSVRSGEPGVPLHVATGDPPPVLPLFSAAPTESPFILSGFLRSQWSSFVLGSPLLGTPFILGGPPHQVALCVLPPLSWWSTLLSMHSTVHLAHDSPSHSRLPPCSRWHRFRQCLWLGAEFRAHGG